MQPLGTKVYVLKGYSPSDSFCTFFLRVCGVWQTAGKKNQLTI